MVDHARFALGPRRLAVRAGSGRKARRCAEGLEFRLIVRHGTACPPGRHAPPRYWVGSTGVEPFLISKWSCGDVTLPVCPACAMTWPRLIVSPRLTINSLACA